MLLFVDILCLDQLKNRLLMPKSGSKFSKALSQLVIVISKAFTEKVKILSQKCQLSFHTSTEYNYLQTTACIVVKKMPPAR